MLRPDFITVGAKPLFEIHEVSLLRGCVAAVGVLRAVLLRLSCC